MSTANDVQEIYIGLLGRAADKPGLDYWVGEIDAGILTIEDVRANIVNEQPEYAEGIGSMTRSQGVTQMYNNLFGRAPEPDGLDYWVNGEGAGVNYDQLVVALINGASPTDRLTLDNRGTVANHFTESPYGSADPFDIDAAAAAIADVDDTQESVNEAIDTIDSGDLSSGESFTLTTGQDVIDGTSGEDTIFGIDADDATTTLTLGDAINGGGAWDTFNLAADNDDLSLSGAQIENVEQLNVINSHNDWDDFDVASVPFELLSVDVGGEESGGLEIDNIDAATEVELFNVEADGESNYFYFDLDSSSTEGNTTLTIRDIDLSDDDEYFYSYSDFRAATTVNTTINLMDIDDQGEDYGGEAYHYLDAGTSATDPMGVMFNTTYNIENVVTEDDFEVYLEVDQAGGGIFNTTINMTDTDNVNFWAELDNDGNGSSAMDVATLNLDNVMNSEGEAEAYVTDTETFNVNVLSDSELEYIGNYYNGDGSGMGSVAVNLDATGDLEVGFWDFNDTNGVTENTTFTITGAGNVTIENLDDGSSNLTVDASAATGDIDLEGLETEVVSVTTNTGDDNIEVGSDETAVSTGDGDDSVDTNGYDFGASKDSAMLDGGAGNDTIAINDGANLDTASAANIENFEVLDVTAGTGTYDMDVETSLKDVVAAGLIVAPVTIDNAASDVALTFQVFDSANVLTMNQKDGSGKADELAITLIANDDNKDQTADGETSAVLVAAEYETINLVSVAQTKSEDSAPGKDDKLEPADYVNKIDLDTTDTQTINVAGIAQAELLFTDAAALTFIDASNNAAGVTADASFGGIVGGLTFKGGAGEDTYTATANGDLIQGNGAADDVTLGASDDTVRFVAASDSQLLLVDTSIPADDKADLALNFDSITGFNAAGTDLIELSSELGLATGDARADILQKGDMGGNSALDLQTFIGDGVDFFDTGVVDRATAFSFSGADGYLWVDVNSDGDFTQADDMFIELAGQATFDITDITFG